MQIFLNTESLARYSDAKACYSDPEKLSALCNDSGKGIRTMFVDLLYYCRQNKAKVKTMIEIAENY